MARRARGPNTRFSLVAPCFPANSVGNGCASECGQGGDRPLGRATVEPDPFIQGIFEIWPRATGSDRTDALAPTPTEIEKRTEARREFLKRASQVAVTTPAVTMLLSAGTKRAVAGQAGKYADPADTNADFGEPGSDAAPGADPNADPGADAGDSF